MLTKMTTKNDADTDSDNAPEVDVHAMYRLLTDENKEIINLLIERLIAEQS